MTRFRHTGRLAIDLSLTGGEGPVYERFEVLHEPADLDRWLAASDLQVEDAGASPEDLRAARELRWAIWNAVWAVLEVEPVPPEHAEVIDEHAARPPLAPSLDGGWQNPCVGAALSDAARDAVALLRDPDREKRLRTCAAPDCIVPFWDDSRPNRRRWCEDSRCGDRLRHRAHRARRKERA